MIVVFFGVLGLAWGSFVNALVWRLHERERADTSKQQIEKKKKTPAASTQVHSIWRGRSMCPDCKHELAAGDLVPVFSWLWLRGRCRYCYKPISWRYPAVELVTAVLFITSYLSWPYSLEGWGAIGLALWLTVVVLGVALSSYDLQWMLLPNKLIYPVGGIVLGLLAIQAILGGKGVLANAVIGSLAFGGFFYLLYQVSKGQWLGGGDVRLGFILGLLLGWEKSLLALSLAAYLGTAIVLVLFLLGKFSRKLKLPFGPLLLAGAFIAFLWGQIWIDWYLHLSGL